jgi:nucleotide-binding universal stress UspA family protein
MNTITQPAASLSKKEHQPVVPLAQPTKFHRILVAMDFSGASPAALHMALRLGMTHQAHLSLLHVFEYAEATPAPAALDADGDAPEGHSAQEEIARHRLDLALQEAKSAGVKATQVFRKGLAPEAILQTVVAEKIDLVILGTNGFRGMERLAHGSTAEAVLRKSTCPVLTVGPHAAHVMEKKPPQGSVVFATDFNRASAPAISYAASFSRLLDAPLRCLHVLPRMVEGATDDDVVPAIIKVALHHVANECKAAGQDTVCDIGYGCDVSYGVIDYARQHDAQLIVLGVRQTSMLASHLPAQIAYRIITEAQCPVLTIAVEHNDPAMLSAACL